MEDNCKNSYDYGRGEGMRSDPLLLSILGTRTPHRTNPWRHNTELIMEVQEIAEKVGVPGVPSELAEKTRCPKRNSERKNQTSQNGTIGKRTPTSSQQDRKTGT